jgi:hypothetical protein
MTFISVLSNAPGCIAPTVVSDSFGVFIVPKPPGGQLSTETITLRWPDACVDPGEFVIVANAGDFPSFFSLSGSYFNTGGAPVETATPSITPTPYSGTATPTPTSTPAPIPAVALDCDVVTPGIQSSCMYQTDVGAVDVDVWYVNGPASASVNAFNFLLHDPDTARLATLPGVDADLDANPDFNQADVTGAHQCTPPTPATDTGADGPGTAVSLLFCYNIGAPNGPLIGANAQLRLARMHYTVPPAATPGSVPLSLSFVAVFDNSFIELGSCLPTSNEVMDCLGATINLVPPPTATPTLTPTATATPIVPGVVKIPEGNANNADQSIPAANLYLCIVGPCAGPGEGNLLVTEHAFNVQTGDQNGDTIADGLGAYEFSVEYDNVVIQSVNPCDIVFSPGGAGAPRGNVQQLTTSTGCAPNPAVINGTCTMSIVLENVIHFGCTTNGQVPGPTGDFDLARLNLIPHPDLANDIFPGNNNGVVTVLKDNGCELVDVFGHPATGSINGGLTPTCGDLAVTVRILEGDLNLDCKVDVTDEQLIGYRYGSFFGSALYGRWYDLEPALHDLDIDVKDIQKVFGRDGSTCQNPVPAQTPVPPPAPFG